MQLPFEAQCVLLAQTSNNHDEYNYLITSCLEIVSHIPRIASQKNENTEAEHANLVIRVCAMIAATVDNALAHVLANSKPIG